MSNNKSENTSDNQTESVYTSNSHVVSLNTDTSQCVAQEDKTITDSVKPEACLDNQCKTDISPAVIKIFTPCFPDNPPFFIDCESQLNGITLTINREYQDRKDQCQSGAAGKISSGNNIMLDISLSEGGIDCPLMEFIWASKWLKNEDTNENVLLILDETGQCPIHYTVEVIPTGGAYKFVFPWTTFYSEENTIEYNVETQREYKIGFFAEKSPFPEHKSAKGYIVDLQGNCTN